MLAVLCGIICERKNPKLDSSIFRFRIQQAQVFSLPFAYVWKAVSCRVEDYNGELQWNAMNECFIRISLDVE